MKSVKRRGILFVTVGVLWILSLLPRVETAARFTHHPPSVLYVQTGQTAKFVWDYTVDDRDAEFAFSSPIWAFYDSQNRRSVIGVEFEVQSRGWNWTIDYNNCPARLINPTVRVRKESTATLVISNVTTADNGMYGCSLILTQVSTPIVSKGRLTVTVPPQFNPRPPLTKNIGEGEELSVLCTATGTPTPNVTWVWMVDNKIKSTGTGSATLRIPDIRRDQNGTYKCETWNNPNERPVTAQTVLTVYYPPQATVTPSSLTIVQHNEISFSCTADGNPPPSISWTKANGVIKAGHTVAGGTLRIPDAIKTDVGKYICTAKNTYDSREHTDAATASVVVKYQPSIMLDTLQNQTVNQSESLSVRCDADGYPPPTITWKTPTGSVYSGSVYNIPSVSRSDAGTYTCTASNGIGRETVASVHVTVKFKPIIDESQSSSKTSSWNGNSILLRCFASCSTVPHITWYKPTRQQITTGINNVPGGSEVTVLTTADQDDYGQYKCQASNILGSDEHFINVTQLFPPGRVAISANKIEASAFTVTWNRPGNDGGSPVTGYLLQVSEKPPELTMKSHAVVTGLKANTQYTVKVSARNIVGYGATSTTIVTTTLKGKPAIPHLLAALLERQDSKLSVFLRWSRPDQNGANIMRYTIYMKEVKPEADWIKHNDVNNPRQVSYRIKDNIIHGKTYKFLVTAWNKYGESVKDEESAKTVNTTADIENAANAMEYCVIEGSKSCISSAVLGVIIALFVLSLVFNLLQFVYMKRRVNLSKNKESQAAQSRKIQIKTGAEESYENDFELENNLSSAAKSSRAQPVQTGPEYETINKTAEIAKFNEIRPVHTGDYQEVNMLPNTSIQEPVYEPLRKRSDDSRIQPSDNGQHPYEPLNVRHQNTTYQSLHKNGNEFVI